MAKRMGSFFFQRGSKKMYKTELITKEKKIKKSE
jgi:hypothetical protein